MKRGLIATVVSLLLAGACAIHLSGSGEYEYEVEAGDPDSVVVVLDGFSLTDSLDENADDDFDLLDDEYDENGEEPWQE